MDTLLWKSLALLGLSSCFAECACEYGAPYSEFQFQVKGRVLSEEGMPIENIQVSIQGGYGKSRIYTDKDGNFESEKLLADDDGAPAILLEDIDGSANGGIFRSKILTSKELDKKEIKKGKYEFSTAEPIKLIRQR